MGKYININSDCRLEYDRDEVVYKKSELLKKFEEFLQESGFSVRWNETKSSPYAAVVSHGNKEYKLVLYLKNITGAGWSDKPHIKRVQVNNVRNEDATKYIDTTSEQTILILGYYNFDNNPLIVAWNAYKYVYHNTIRSCYVTIDNLIEGYRNGIIETECSEQKIWVFQPKYFGEFLDSYIRDNTIGE